MPKTANKPTAQTVCANVKCPYNKQGCTLFQGAAWMRCRKARVDRKPARKAGAK